MHSYHGCKDPGSPFKTEAGKISPRYDVAFESFLDRYFDKITGEDGFAPIDLIACWDEGRDYREQLLPTYKANRLPADPSDQKQMDAMFKLTKNFLAAVGSIQVSVKGVEADDVVAYVAPRIKPICNVYTVDNDLVQLASDTVQVFVKDEEKNSYLEAPFHLIALHKSLVGDKTDNYLGVRGFGQKAWETMVADFGIDGMEELKGIAERGIVKEVLEMDADCNSKQTNLIAEQAADWLTAYQLALLHPELCHGFGRTDKIAPKWFKRVPDDRRLDDCLNRAGLGHLFDKYVSFCPIQYLFEKGDTVEDIFEDIGDNIVAFDYESFDPEPQASLNEVDRYGNYVNVLQQRITGGSFCFGNNLQYVVYIPVEHRDTDNQPLSMIKEVLTMNEARVVHNAAFEKVVSDINFGMEIMTNVCDTQMMSHHVDENREVHNLKSLSSDYLNYTQTTFKELMEHYGKDNMSQLSGQEVLEYGCDDALVDAHLWSFMDLIMMIEGTEEFCYENEFHFVDVVGESFKKGVPIDWELLAKMEQKSQKDLDVQMEKLRGLLRDHCREINTKALTLWMKEQTPFLKAKAEAQIKDKGGHYNEVSEEFFSKAEEKWHRLAVYNEYTVSTETEDFLPTLKKLEKLLEMAGMLTATGLPTSMAGSRITEWLMRLEDVELTTEQRDVLGTLAEATTYFKTRDAEGMHTLNMLYKDLQTKAGKVKVTEEGDTLNTDSPDQMQALIYLKLGLPIRIRSKVDYDSFRDRWRLDGNPSANDKAIESALAEDAPEGSWERDVLMTLREVKSTLTLFKFYFRPYPKWKFDSDGRIHPQVKNCGTTSRRPSGTSPNILQVKKGPIRQLYLPMANDHILISPDFNGQELRITASESLDPVLLDAYLSVPNKDIHSLTACSFAPNMVKRMWPDLSEFVDLTEDGKHMVYESFIEWLGVSEDDVDNQDFLKAAKFLRGKRAKATNFTAAYGGGFPALSLNLLIPEKEAKELLEAMFSLYVRLKPWQQEVADLARLQGFVKTVFGSMRHATVDIISREGGFRSRMERQIVNFMAQGTAADVLKVVVKEMVTTGLLKDTHSFMVAPVYDEVLCSVPIPYAQQFCERLQKIMDLTPPGHQVPMMSEFKLGFSWGDMVEIGTDTSFKSVEDGMRRARKLIDTRRGKKEAA